MRNFTILFNDMDGDSPRRMEFTAEDPAGAFFLAEREAGSRPFEIWEGQKRLGTITRSSDQVWRLG